MEWEWVISLSVIVGLILAVWARVGNQTIMELIRDIGDYLQELGGAAEPAVEI